MNKGYTPNKGHAFEPNLLCTNSGHTLIVVTLCIFFKPNKGHIFFLWGNSETRRNGKGAWDSNTLVISYNGGRVPRAALREAVMTNAALTTLRRLNVSGL